MTKQPQWKRVANLGDVDPIEHDGFFVYVDRTGVYPPEAELLIRTEPSWLMYRFVLEPCTYTDDILSDNPSHPEMGAWFADKLQSIADTSGMTVDSLIAGFLSDDPVARAWSWKAVGDYHGFDNLDQYPMGYAKRSDLPRRIRRGK